LLILIVTITIVWWPFNIYVQFSYINAKLEAIGNPFLNEKELNRLIESKNLNELKETLNTNKDYNIIGNNSNELHKSLDLNYIETLEKTKKDSSKKMNEFFNIFYEKIDLVFIKNLIKNKLKNISTEEDNLNKINLKKTKKLYQDILDSENEKILDLLINYGFDEEIKNISITKDIDFILLDNKTDSYIINKLKNVKIPQKCRKAKEDFVNRIIDIKNLKNILRAKNLSYNEKTCEKLFLGEGKEISNWKFQELLHSEDINQVISSLEGTSYFNDLKENIEIYNNEKSTQIFEKVLDERLLKNLKEISIQNYVHIGPIIRYITSKEYEIMNLKIISKGIEENINPDIIKKLTIMVKS
jgi:V/A-type H+-transporting ATPase subunit C